MSELVIDAKPASTSSVPAKSDAKPASSTVVSAPTEGGSVLDTALKIAGVSETPTEPESVVQGQDNTAEGEAPKEHDGEEAPVEKEEVEVEKKEEPVDDKLPPFHEHPRWKEMVTERDTLRQQVEEQKELVQAQREVVNYCTENGITQEQYGQALEFLRALNTGDTGRAREIMGPILGMLDGRVEGQLPEDLALDVKNGDLSQKRAEEIAQLRAQQAARQKFSEQNARRASAFAVQNAVQSWAEATHKKDPAFKPKANGEPDGLYELVNAKVLALGQQTQARTPADVVGLLERAYNDVKQSLSRFVPKPPAAGKQLPATGASRTAKPTYNNPVDLAMAVARGEVKSPF